MASGRKDSFPVEFSGELTIRSIGEAHQRLSEALAEHGSVVARVAQDAVIDLTFVQLIESARRSAQADGRAFAMAAPAEGSLRETLQRGGFLGEAAGREFWLQGDQ